MHRWLILSLVFAPLTLSAQRMLPIGTYFRDLVFAPEPPLSGSDSIIEILVRQPYGLHAAIFPISERDVPVLDRIKDTRKRYSSAGHYLYQREPIELKDDDAKLWITPLFDISYMKESSDTSGKKYQNTRGARAEGVFGKRVFFTTSFYENQAILMSYADAYVRERGEQYARPDSTYLTQNAVIPGSARTKPFKVTGFDYTYATGMISVAATDKLTINWGNQPFFIGSGYRSMLWSDNSVPLMNLHLNYRFSPRWEVRIIRARGFNLLRKSYKESAEANYEPKLFSVAMVTYSPSRKLSISLFEGGTWYRGDSLSQSRIPALYYVPLPGVATAQQQIDNQSAFSVLGWDIKGRVGRNWMYAQVALTQGKKTGAAYQLGLRIFPTKNPFFQVQAEYNHADDATYASVNPRNNYSHFNLPLAHPAANGFDEFLLRCVWEQNHCFISFQGNYYPRQQTDMTLLMPVIKPAISGTQTVVNTLLEAGYRFNRTYCLEAFASFRYRHAEGLADYERSWITAGIRTNINNHYFDF